VTFEFYAWQVQLVLSLLFATHVARLAGRKGRHPFGAALLMLTFANVWPFLFAGVGNGIASVFGMNDTARMVFVRVFAFGGMMFGVAVSYAIVGCLRPRKPNEGLNPVGPHASRVADIHQPRDRDNLRSE
jgi:phage shock protein PspC (stress-responsive transcriptional regulator)